MYGSTNADAPHVDRPQRALARVAVLALAVVLSSAAIATAAEPRTSWVKDRNFNIPINVRGGQSSDVKQLLLWFSTDQGRTWDVKPLSPERKSLKFRAETDGEYWFALTYVDRSDDGTAAKTEPKAPKMIVFVDTVAPVVTLKASPAKDGVVGVNWNIDDAQLDAESFSLKIRSRKEQEWHKVKVDASAVGQKQWPYDPGEDYEAMLTVSDRAGNVATQKIDVPGAPIAGSTATPPAAPIASAAKPNDLIPPAPVKQVGGAWEGDGMPIPTAPAAISRQPAVRGGNVAAAQPPAPTPAAPGRPVFDWTRVDVGPDRASDDGVAESGRRVAKKPAKNDSEIAKVDHTEPAPQLQPAPPPVEEVRIKLVSSADFQLSYDISGAGPAGVGRVELYMTSDGGTTWKLVGDDPDLESPIDVHLPGEGKYGLSIVVTNKAGVGQRPPKSGDKPELLVHVDTTPPDVRLHQPVPDVDSPREVMVLSWESKDEHPAERGVELLFSPDPDRGWFRIASGLPASGSYKWRVPDRIPHQVYFRAVCRDQADNVETVSSKKPVVVDMSNPAGKIGGIINVLPKREAPEPQ